MSSVGKVLVVVNTALSIMFLMWALSVHSENINWFTPPDAKDKAKEAGIVNKAEATLKELGAASQDAARRWSHNAYEVAVQEFVRPQRRDFYRGMVVSVQTGKGQVPGPKGPELVSPPVQELPTDQATGLVRTVPNAGKPVTIGSEALNSIENYREAIAAAGVEIQKRQTAIKGLIEEHKKKTALIAGTASTKGLRTLITEQEQIRDAARLEYEYLQPFWTRRFAEHAALIRRRDALGERLKELTKFEEVRSGGQ